ncbi:hypothetical protein JH06_2322 [Blastocystis sp. subtype 4]|uniref:hypothetical protein n=1 Tax=Blastocystis sp. subtype 4 TaxID=944170 RepID=UPI000711481A|nr:hypothetical protein JH06_2322 [Blastocystis sp. subtype 4]KNB43940.1 hypothetical protein JH06_2322 [Blastocystis sp. subtype 4]|eukprot:XP_014527383.1 hypothetical protein JH06_2322 [Blastocystis sp. subtype 4]
MSSSPYPSSDHGNATCREIWDEMKKLTVFVDTSLDCYKVVSELNEYHFAIFVQYCITLLYIDVAEAKRFFSTYRLRHLLFHEDKLIVMNQVIDDPKNRQESDYHQHFCMDVTMREVTQFIRQNKLTKILEMENKYVYIVIDPTTSGTPAVIIAQQKILMDRQKKYNSPSSSSENSSFACFTVIS